MLLFEVDKNLADTGIVRTFYHIMSQKLKDSFERKKLHIFSLFTMNVPLYRDLLPGIELHAETMYIPPDNTFIAERKTCHLLGENPDLMN